MTEIDYYSNGRKDILPYIPSNIKRSLDVGCATGVFSSNLKKNGVTETWGIEMEQQSAIKAQTMVDNVLIGSFDDVYDQIPKQYFDCIFFNDVLEHMMYPEDCLKKVKENLHPQGHILTSIPNIRHVGVLRKLLFGKDWQYEDSGILDRTHLRFFTQKSMVRMFEDCGYTVKMIEGINGVGRYCLTSVINTLLFNKLHDIKYKQFVLLASPK